MREVLAVPDIKTASVQEAVRIECCEIQQYYFLVTLYRSYTSLPYSDSAGTPA
jgi:hypothetical protein